MEKTYTVEEIEEYLSRAYTQDFCGEGDGAKMSDSIIRQLLAKVKQWRECEAMLKKGRMVLESPDESDSEIFFFGGKWHVHINGQAVGIFDSLHAALTELTKG